MRLWFRPWIRHPFFPALVPTLARHAKGRVEALCGSFVDLIAAAQRGIAVTRAIFVLMKTDAPPLDERQRDRLWNLFEVPVYAVITGPTGVVAFECEAHNGYHLATSSGGCHTITCECGRPGAVVDAARWQSAEGAPMAQTATEGV